MSTEGRNFLSIDHRGSSGAGDAPELTRLRAGPALHFLFLLAGIRVSLNIDKFLPKHYNIYKYNTKGKRRSAHSPKGGVAYVEIISFAHQASARCKYDNYHHKEITALLAPER